MNYLLNACAIAIWLAIIGGFFWLIWQLWMSTLSALDKRNTKVAHRRVVVIFLAVATVIIVTLAAIMIWFAI